MEFLDSFERDVIKTRDVLKAPKIIDEPTLTETTITFGKYKNSKLDKLLMDIPYCEWLLKQTWFITNHSFLYNSIKNYFPSEIFNLPRNMPKNITYDNYPYFFLKHPNTVKNLSKTDSLCYSYYFILVESLKKSIRKNEENNLENKFDLKAPSGYLKKFEQTTGLSKDVFNQFLIKYRLANILKIFETIKSFGNLSFNGNKGFLIAKQNSRKQEAYWKNHLKQVFGENLADQFKYQNNIFDFVSIKYRLIFECKLGIKDFCMEQYQKYSSIKGYSIIYLVGYDTIIDMENFTIYTTNELSSCLFTGKTTFEQLLINFQTIKITENEIVKTIQKMLENL